MFPSTVISVLQPENEERCGEESFGSSCTQEDCNSGTEFGSETESEMEQPNSDDFTYINDPVHGMIEIQSLIKAIIDTPHFQRLRFLKQCGLSNFVYPGAIHTRFDHCLGVYYLASRVVNKLQQLNVKITPEECLCIQIAALCHDLGHGPFSHSWEGFVRTVSGDKFQHEEMSVNMLDDLIDCNPRVKESFESWDRNKKYRQFIKDLILGEAGEDKRKYLFEIVANKATGLDVDKYEYLLRDSYFFGIKINTDFERYLTCIKIVKDKKGNEHIGYLEKLKWQVLDVFKSRAQMHNIGYQHRVCICLEAMLLDVLRLADEHFKVAIDGENSRSYKLSECHRNVKTMLKLTDHIFQWILYSEDESLSEARELIQRILKRDLYSEVYVRTIENGENNPNGFSALMKYIEEMMSEKYSDANFRCRLKKLELGQSDREGVCDPLKYVWFINKKGESFQEDPKTRDSLLWLPMNTRCVKLYVFCDKKATSAMKEDAKIFYENFLKKA